MTITAAAIIAEPSFATDPAAWVNFATTRAAEAHKRGRPEEARHWTYITRSLIAAADSPHVTAGVSLTGLLRTYTDAEPQS